MKKTRQFDDIKNGELIRFLVEPPFYEKEKKHIGILALSFATI